MTNVNCECKNDGFGCKIHVACDDECKALFQPETLEEYDKALEHWIDHRSMSGCSHGC